jgi:hypothetical protein
MHPLRLCKQSFRTTLGDNKEPRSGRLQPGRSRRPLPKGRPVSRSAVHSIRKFLAGGPPNAWGGWRRNGWPGRRQSWHTSDEGHLLVKARCWSAVNGSEVFTVLCASWPQLGRGRGLQKFDELAEDLPLICTLRDVQTNHFGLSGSQPKMDRNRAVPGSAKHIAGGADKGPAWVYANRACLLTVHE